VTRLKALYLLKQNIRALLEARGQEQQALAKFCHKTDAWISQILNRPERGFQVQELDRMAEFFGLEPYQLFQPGISALGERRSGRERRSGMDRRLRTAREILEQLPSYAELQQRVSALSPEEYRTFVRRAMGALALVDRAPGGTPPPDHADQAERPPVRSRRTRAK